ncbi:tRNA adenosine(34) deaminase TadA [Lentisphaerota bacterium ZTH]|nr:nucleoside deaminase [Lentisphaerota bacterium]WET06365.1 tRNA adenosine(34) deaminase TadA [Lentisphaerota bacterium ZTH]
MIIFDDEHFMRRALAQAEIAFDAGEVPVGAVAVMNDRIIARASNQVELLKDATAHAEILVITEAARAIGDWRLDNVDIYVTKEPCAMCAGAMVNSRVRRVIYGMPDPRTGACGSAMDITGFKQMLWNVEVKSGVLEHECRCLVQDFFRKVRTSKELSGKKN